MKTFRLLFLFLLLICVKCISQPVVTSFSPTFARVGDTITINGKNFSTTPSNNFVRFGNVTGNVVSATGTSLKVSVPIGASYSQITVSVNNLTGYSGGFFTPSFTSCTNGSLTFGTPIDSVFYNNNPFVARDYDGDGRVDMANISDSLYIKLNTSNSGMFSEAMGMTYNGIGSNATYLTDGDLNGDGKLDILSAVGDTIFILKNESIPGDISFTKTSLITSFQAGSAVIADFDGDGKPDIIITDINTNDSVFAIFKNIGNGDSIEFGKEIDFKIPIENIYTIKVADINGDEKPDIIVSSLGGAGVWVIKNTTKSKGISFAKPVELSLSTFSLPLPQIQEIDQIELGDFDGDGKTDIALGFKGAIFEELITGVYILKNTSASGSISFNLPQLAGNGTGVGDGDGNEGALFHGFAIADIDGDGKPDIVYLTSDYQYSIVNSFFNFEVTLNNCTPDSISFTDLGGAWTLPAYTIQLADMDGDGKPDVICGSQIFLSSCTLPVTLLDFSAKPVDKQIALYWHTATELNTSHFIIQHSTDGSSFKDIGNVQAIGSGANSYTYTDNNPANGINYYRLESVDKDGGSSYSKVVSVQFTVDRLPFTVVPNPARDVATIKGSHIASVQVIDNMGRVVKIVSLKDATNPVLSVSGLAAGVYHLRVQTMDGEVSGIGFVKE